MDSVTKMEEILQEVLGASADRLAKETGFIKRQRAFSGSAFVQGLVCGWLGHPQARLVQLTQALAYQEVEISASGLQQRFGPAAARFLQAVLQALIQPVIQGAAVDVSWLNQFAAVLVEDSTTIVLPPELAGVWQGCGGADGKRCEAGLKLHVQWDLLHGTLFGPVLSHARLSDLRSPLRERPLEPNSLYVADEGYFALPWLQHLAHEGSFFVSRPKSMTAFFDAQGTRLDLLALGPQVVHQMVDLPVQVGTRVRLPARLLMIRVPDEVAEQRREDIRANAKRRGRTPSQEHLALAAWTLLITNVPQERLSSTQVVVIQRARWQIELLFKLWKSDGGHLETWRSTKPWRILCEVYARLIALLIQHWTLIQGVWHDPARSLVKAAAVVRDHAFAFQEVFLGERSLRSLLTRLEYVMRQGCRIDHRLSEPSFFQLLTEGLDWPLTS